VNARPLVYLAGAIAGLAFDDATDWRHAAKLYLGERNIETLNPMRAKEALGSQNAGQISTNFNDYKQNGAFFTAKGIMTRDSTDVRRADALLVNLLGLKKPSLGTVMELGWAFILNKPCVVAIEAEGNPHDNHPMIHEAMPFRVTTLDEAFDSVAVLLNR
jgi:nucleoside 2-deoxyribosyltransferase